MAMTLDRIPATTNTLRNVDAEEWRACVDRCMDQNYQQCISYAAALARRENSKVEAVGLFDGGSVIGLAILRIIRPPFLQRRGFRLGIAYLAGGPLIDRAWRDDYAGAFSSMLSSLKREYCDRRGLLLRIAPHIADPARMDTQSSCFQGGGFRVLDHVRIYKTIVVDLERPHAQIEARLGKKWRRDLRRAEREGVQASFQTTLGPASDFEALFSQLVDRKSLTVDLDAEFYLDIQARLASSKRYHIGIARANGEPVAGILASALGDTAVCLLAASNSKGRQTRAAFLLQWRFIQLAKEYGCRRYDLGGIDPVVNPGVYRFKAGMGGAEMSVPQVEVAPGRLQQETVHFGERLLKRISRYGF